MVLLKCSHEAFVAGCSTHFSCVAHMRRLIAPLANVSLAAPPANVSCSELGVVCTWILETLWLSLTIAADLFQAKEPTTSNSSSSSCVRFPQNSHQGKGIQTSNISKHLFFGCSVIQSFFRLYDVLEIWLFIFCYGIHILQQLPSSKSVRKKGSYAQRRSSNPLCLTSIKFKVSMIWHPGTNGSLCVLHIKNSWLFPWMGLSIALGTHKSYNSWPWSMDEGKHQIYNSQTWKTHHTIWHGFSKDWGHAGFAGKKIQMPLNQEWFCFDLLSSSKFRLYWQSLCFKELCFLHS